MNKISIIGPNRTQRILFAQAISMLSSLDLLTKSSSYEILSKYGLDANKNELGYKERLICLIEVHLEKIILESSIDGFISEGSSFDEFILLSRTIENEKDDKIRNEYRNMTDSLFKIVAEYTNCNYDYTIFLRSGDEDLNHIYEKYLSQSSIKYLIVDEPINMDTIGDIMNLINQKPVFNIDYVCKKILNDNNLIL